MSISQLLINAITRNSFTPTKNISCIFFVYPKQFFDLPFFFSFPFSTPPPSYLPQNLHQLWMSVFQCTSQIGSISEFYIPTGSFCIFSEIVSLFSIFSFFACLSALSFPFVFLNWQKKVFLCIFLVSFAGSHLPSPI